MRYLVLIVLIVLEAKSSLACPNPWALTEVDIWAHRSSSDRGEHYKSLSLNMLNKYQMIEVTKANVSVLCEGMVKNFPQLAYLTLIEANISKILPGAFQQLPKLRHLSLSLNHLTTLERYQFQNLESLKVLYLSSNRIENIEDDAFADLTNIRKIYLDHNQIHEINSKWFLEFPQISLIDLSFNKISKVQKAAFTIPKGSVVEIRLQRNTIEEVEPGAVEGVFDDDEVPYLTLRLDSNNLTEIAPELLQSVDKFQTSLFFNSNRISCLPPETIRMLKTVIVNLNLLSNPLRCDCLDAIASFKKGCPLLRSTIDYSSTLECSLYGVKPPDDWNWSSNSLY